VPEIDEHSLVRGKLFVRILFRFGRRRGAEEKMTAVEREAQVPALADNKLFAEAGRAD